MAFREKYSQFAIEVTVFLCGAMVMIFEITGSRIVSPFIGASTYVWTSLIGVILGALSLGYWLGGRLADKKPDPRMLASIIFLAGGLVAITILIRDIVLTAVAAMPAPLEIKSVFAALFLFAPPSVALGTVAPYAVRLRMSSIGDSGKTVGKLYALSTIGSIVGTFAAGFFLIPFAGSTRTLYLIAIILFVVAVIVAPLEQSKAKLVFVVILLFGIAANELNAVYPARRNNLIDLDTEYSRVQIFESTEPESGRRIRAIATDPYFLQSAMYLDGDDPVFKYSRFYRLLGYLRPDFSRTLMIGGAGYSFPKEHLQLYPKATIDVVEIDSRMTEIAIKHFRLENHPRMRIYHEDGRMFLNRADTATYDAVLMDAFGSLFSVPYQLSTVEAVRQIERALKDGGIVIFNLGSAIRGPGSGFLQAEFKTYQSVFPYVYLFKVRPELADDALQNLIVVACKANCLEDARFPAAFEIPELLDRRYTPPLPLDKPILTDDLAPVEYYGSIGLRVMFR
ncbi:MAG: fused MFS/spermidine synthase [Pyrinomonadaceae bacterium]